MPFKTAFGEITVYESFVAANVSKIEFLGQYPGEQFGASIANGDFNGDGIDDLIIGSPFSSVEQREWNGKVSIYFGREDVKTKKNQTTTFSPDVIFYGKYSGDQLGTSLTAGDFNNDGIEDVVIGAYNAYNKRLRPGKVYIVFGQLTWSRQAYDFFNTEPDIGLMGMKNDEGFGLSLSTVDISNDGIDDILIGSPFSSSDETKKSGMVYGFFGGDEFVSTDVYMSEDANVTFYGHATNERFGSAISGGHILDKNLNDIVISAYTADDADKSQVGKIYLYRGRYRFPAKPKSPTVTITGTQEGEWFGFSLVVGDVNKDAKDDLVASSFPYNGNRDFGKVSVFYNRKALFSVGASFYADEKTADIVVKEPREEALIGANVLLDDFDADQKKEIIVGSPGIGDPKSAIPGDVYIVFDDGSKKNVIYSAEDESITSTIHGENADDWFGFSVASLDFNNDGYQDLAIGSRYSDGPVSDNNGKVHVILGSGKPFGNSKTVASPGDRRISRAEVIHEILEKLDIKTKKADFIASCYEYKEFCLFNFIAMSLYNDIKLDPKPILYPDIPENHEYYEDIVVGTMLGLVNGMTTEKDTPFHPNDSISRINALKVILGAADLVKPMYRFELIKEFGSYENLLSQPSYFEDVDPRISYTWWYPRYTNFAVEHGIIKTNRVFRPDDRITINEFNAMLGRTIDYLNSQSQVQDEEAQP